MVKKLEDQKNPSNHCGLLLPLQNTKKQKKGTRNKALADGKYSLLQPSKAGTRGKMPIKYMQMQ